MLGVVTLGSTWLVEAIQVALKKKSDNSNYQEGVDFHHWDSKTFLKADKQSLDSFIEEKGITVVVTVGSKITKHFTPTIFKIAEKVVAKSGGLQIVAVSDKYDNSNIVTALERVGLATEVVNGFEYKKAENPYRELKTIEEVLEVFELIEAEKICCFDTESRSWLPEPVKSTQETESEFKERMKAYNQTLKGRALQWFRDDVKPTCLGLAVKTGFTYVIPLWHKDSVFPPDVCEVILREFVVRIIQNPDIRKVAHNMKYDLHLIYSMIQHLPVSCQIRGQVDDTILMAHIINENVSKGLKSLTDTYIPKFKDYDLGINYQEDPLDVLYPYLSIDCNNSLHLLLEFETELLKDWRLYQYYRNMSIPLFAVLFDAEHEGVTIDEELLDTSIKEAVQVVEEKQKQLLNDPIVKRFILNKRREQKIELIEENQKKLSSCKQFTAKGEESAAFKKYTQKSLDLIEGKYDKYELNFNSPKQLVELFYNHPSGFKFEKLIDTYGNVKESTDVESLRSIDHPYPMKLLIYRSMVKLLNTYFIGIKELLHKGKIHTSFNQNGTKTHRISCSNPNLLNITSRVKFDDEDYAKLIIVLKKLFVSSRADYLSIQIDYSQAELRVAAGIATDPTMMEAYLSGKDLHSLTAANVLGISYEEFLELPKDVRKEKRQEAKGYNFGIIYDISYKALVAYVKANYQIEISEKEAKQAMRIFFEKFDKLLDWHSEYGGVLDHNGKCIQEGKVQKYGYVRTLLGTKRRLPEINSADKAEVKKARRLAINNPIQGTATQILLFGMIIMRHKCPNHLFQWSTVYDSVNNDVHKDFLEDYWRIAKNTFENTDRIVEYFGANPDKLKVPMKIDFAIAPEESNNWGSHIEYDSYEDYIKSN